MTQWISAWLWQHCLIHCLAWVFSEPVQRISWDVPGLRHATYTVHAFGRKIACNCMCHSVRTVCTSNFLQAANSRRSGPPRRPRPGRSGTHLSQRGISAKLSVEGSLSTCLGVCIVCRDIRSIEEGGNHGTFSLTREFGAPHAACSS